MGDQFAVTRWLEELPTAELLEAIIYFLRTQKHNSAEFNKAKEW